MVSVVAALIAALTVGFSGPQAVAATPSVARAEIIENFEGSLWGLAAVRARDAWSITRGAGVVVAVIDTGVDATHGDLTGNVLDGWSTVANRALPANANNDGGGHGTHVAGTIAGADNGSGIVGVAPDAKILPVQVLGDDGSGSDRSVADGIDWAVRNGADVINLSLGGESNPFAKDASRSCAAVGSAFDAGVVVVVSAGNDGAAGNPRSEPASCRGALSVTAVDETLNRSYFSSFDGTVGISAPGSAIISSVPSNKRYPFAQWNGTSMAAPHVAGVAALIRAANPSWTAQQVIDRIKSSAVDLGPSGNDPEYGAGLVDAAAAVGLPPVSRDTLKASVAATGTPVVVSATGNGSNVTVRWNAPKGTDSKSVSYRVELFGDPEGGAPTATKFRKAFFDVGTVTEITVPYKAIPTVVRVTATSTSTATSGPGRVALPFFDIKNLKPSSTPRVATRLTSASATWTSKGVKVSFTTSGPTGPVTVSVNAGLGQMFLYRTVSSADRSVLFAVPTDSAARSLNSNVAVSTERGSRYVTLPPQYLVKVTTLTAGERTVSVSGSTSEACNSAARAGCAGSAVVLRDARTGKEIARSWVLANLRFGFDLNRESAPERVYVTIGSVRSMDVTYPTYSAKTSTQTTKADEVR